MNRIILVCSMLVGAILLAGCTGGGLMTTMNVGDGSDARWTSWDMLAPAVDVPTVDEGLAGARYLKSGGRSVTALDTLNATDDAVLDALRVESDGNELRIYAKGELSSAPLYVAFDAKREHVVSVEMQDGNTLCLARAWSDGVHAVGVTATRGTLDTNTPLAVVTFADGAAGPVRRVNEITQDNRARVKDVAAVGNAVDGYTVTWGEVHPGDYDNNGQVTINDLTPLGREYQTSFDETDARWAELVIIDGDQNGVLNISDLTPIGQSIGSNLTGYNVYRTTLTEAEIAMDPVVIDPDAQPSRWTRIENSTDAAGPSAPREWNGSDLFRLNYTFIDTPAGNDSYGWYVVPVGPDGNPREEGKASDVAVVVHDVPDVTLSFEIQPPSGALMNVNDEFYIAVKVAGIEGLFSANVRFEYDGSLVEFVEAVSAYDDKVNLLTPPLFLAADDIDDAADPYVLLGFNATERNGVDDPVSGDGALGYFKFRAIAAGINQDAFRFPQSSTFLHLWGTQYGVEIATPAMGPGQLLNIAE